MTRFCFPCGYQTSDSLLDGLWNPDVLSRIQKVSLVILILSQINPVPCIVNNLFKYYSYVVLSSTPSLRSLSCVLYLFIYIIFIFDLMGCSLLPNALRPFKNYCASPNLGIRT